MLRGEQTLRMARQKAPELLLCKETLTMALPKASKLLRCSITLQMALAKAHKVLVCPFTGSMALVKAPKQSQLQHRPAREGICVPARTVPPMKALWLRWTHKGPARRPLCPRSSVVNVATNKCASSKLPRPSSRSWRTCPSQSGTLGRAQQSRDCEDAKCLQLRCTARACRASDLHGTQSTKLALPVISASSAFSYGADAQAYLHFVCGLIFPVMYVTARLSVSASGP